ncbi:putative uncharacterized protein [Eggerthella sp. CAG:1427]|nr:putative uncharacterized protein [Eggerthella sp. CAG:1427]
MRAQQHIPDACLIRKKHNYTVDTDANTTCRRHAIFKSTNVVSVVFHCLIITRSLFFHLLLETLGLIYGIVQFGECISIFMACDYQFKTLSQTRIVFETLCKRTYLNRIINNKCWIYDGRLTNFIIKLGNQLTSSPLWLYLNAILLCKFHQMLNRSIKRYLFT